MTGPVDALVWNEGKVHFLGVNGTMYPEKSFMYIPFYTFSRRQFENYYYIDGKHLNLYLVSL